MPEYGVGSRRSGVDAIEVDDGNFDYDDRIEVETSQKVGKDFWLRPIGGVVNQKGPYHISIEPTTDKYLQLNRARLEMVLAVVNEDGTDISRMTDVVAPVNMIGAVIWKEIVARLNGNSFDGACTVNCGYKAYIETMLSCDFNARDTHLTSSCFHMDSPDNYSTMVPSAEIYTKCFLEAVEFGEFTMPDVADNLQPAPGEDPITRADLQFLARYEFTKEREVAVPAGGVLSEAEKKKRRRNVYRDWFEAEVGTSLATLRAHQGGDHVNHGFNSRYHLVTGSTPFDVYVPITHDFFKLNNHLGPGNKLDLMFVPYPDNFLLNTYLEKNYKIKILDMKLHLRSIERKERIPLPLKERYLMNQTEMHKQLIAANTPNTTFRIHNGGVMPKTIVVAMVAQRAADGQYDRNPFFLHHHHVKKIALVINGEITPADGLNMDFTSENALMSKAFSWMYENTGTVDSERGNLITWKSFKGGCFIVPFDMTPDKCK